MNAPKMLTEAPRGFLSNRGDDGQAMPQQES
jgi:hypothetical protein